MHCADARWLNLGSTSVTGAGLQELKELKKLRSLALRGTS
jgi:hypothetical protein